MIMTATSSIDASEQATAHEISLEQLFDLQDKSLFRGTIQRIGDDDANVLVTPWEEGESCICGEGTVVPRRSIVKIVDTENCISCCGKKFHIVEITFSRDNELSYDDLFKEIQTLRNGGSNNRDAHSRTLKSGPILPMMRQILKFLLTAEPSDLRGRSGGGDWGGSSTSYDPDCYVNCAFACLELPPGSRARQACRQACRNECGMSA
jgi:hypothetical protein